MLMNVSHVLYIILSPILSTLFIALNAVTIYVFCKKFKLTTVCVILIVNTCACDIFVCLVSNSFYMFNLLDPKHAWRTGSLCCKLFKFLTMFTNVAQIYFLCFLTADRLRRLVYATKSQWRKRDGILFMVIGWTTALILTAPRLALFDEKIIRKFSSKTNQSVIVNVNCKPIGLKEDGYIVSTALLFILGYATPACYIVYAAVRTQAFMWKRRHSIHLSSTSNFVTKMKSKLSLTFNMTASFFMLIWTPFFLLSVADLALNLLGRKDLIHVNFTLRCSLLILGSAKPIIYLICLEKFRNCFSLNTGSGLTKDAVIETSTQPRPSNVNGDQTMETPVTPGTTGKYLLPNHGIQDSSA